MAKVTPYTTGSCTIVQYVTQNLKVVQFDSFNDFVHAALRIVSVWTTRPCAIKDSEAQAIT